MHKTSAASLDFDPVTHTYRREGSVVPHVTQILAMAGKCDWSFVDEEIRLHSIARGRSVHWMCQLEDEGALNYRTTPIRLRGYRKAWQRWKENAGFVPVWIEHKFYSTHGFCGTMDRAGNLPTGIAIIDLKTGPIVDATRLQLAGYSLGFDPRPGVARNIRRIAVRLMPDGQYVVKEYLRSSFDADLAEFMECLKGIKRQDS